MNNIAETSLIEQAKKGNPDAFGELIDLNQSFVYNLALKAVSSYHEAQDITQETFIRAWKGLHNFRGESSFRTWLFRILMNHCYDRYPHLQREMNNLSIDEDEIEIPMDFAMEQFTDQKEFENFIHQQLKELPEIQRLVLNLRYQQDCSYQEIAEVMDMPIGTVKTTIFRAKARLKELFVSKQEVYTWIA
ncbi:MAG TPA: RNA polymerase sigma factor [Anaerolineaceae bacterium]|nr:RNA polymerase sigma factor [Anaerolineaceae bacterium]